MKFLESFGFLKYPASIEFEGGSIFPVDDYDEKFKAVTENTSHDGYYYRPSTSSDRSTATFSLPLSHNLYIENTISNSDIRFEDAGFVIHKLGFFFGTRLQFKDWRFDGKVPIDASNSFLYQEDIPCHYLAHAYQTWRTWDEEQRKRYVNILYMFDRTKSCEWEWDAFTYQYIVFDAIYRFHVLQGNEEIRGHKNRLFGLCEFYGIARNDETIEEIYHLRNNLFHEALWDGGTPGYSHSEAYLSEIWLGRLNSRLIVSLTGYNNIFSKSGWWSFGWQRFDKFKS